MQVFVISADRQLLAGLFLLAQDLNWGLKKTELQNLVLQFWVQFKCAEEFIED